MKYFLSGMVGMLVVTAFLYAIQGHSNGDDPVVVDTFPTDERSYFVLRHSTHIYDPNRYFVRLKTAPPDNLPAKQGLVDIDLLLRGVDVPVKLDNAAYRVVHFRRTKRSDARRDAAIAFVWDILSNTEYAWVDNWSVSEDGTAILCDIFYSRGAAVISLAEAMIEMGHAKPISDVPYDWGNP